MLLKKLQKWDSFLGTGTGKDEQISFTFAALWTARILIVVGLLTMFVALAGQLLK